jgi:hypothetical protein
MGDGRDSAANEVINLTERAKKLIESSSGKKNLKNYTTNARGMLSGAFDMKIHFRIYLTGISGMEKC